MTRYRTAFERVNRRRPRREWSTPPKPRPCFYCRAKDSRDAAHQTGCPSLPELPKAELIRIAREVEVCWDPSLAEEERSKGAAA